MAGKIDDQLIDIPGIDELFDCVVDISGADNVLAIREERGLESFVVEPLLHLDCAARRSVQDRKGARFVDADRNRCTVPGRLRRYGTAKHCEAESGGAQPNEFPTLHRQFSGFVILCVYAQSLSAAAHSNRADTQCRLKTMAGGFCRTESVRRRRYKCAGTIRSDLTRQRSPYTFEYTISITACWSSAGLNREYQTRGTSAISNSFSISGSIF